MSRVSRIERIAMWATIIGAVAALVASLTAGAIGFTTLNQRIDESRIQREQFNRQHLTVLAEMTAEHLQRYNQIAARTR